MSDRPLNFDRYDSVESLAFALRCEPEVLYTTENDFIKHKIPKKNPKKGYRTVWEIEKKNPLKQVLQTFYVSYNLFLRNKIKDFPSPCSHGFLDKKSIVTNCRPHAGKSIILKADIKNFFDTITCEHLKEHFLEAGLNLIVSETLSQMLTINGTLPQGFCTSPLMSNVIFLHMDLKLQILGLKYNCDYTRYGDDITFSSFEKLPTKNEILEILQQKGFELEPSKFRIKKNGQAFFVTGLSISDFQPRIPKKFKHNLRQELYFLTKYGFDQHAGRKNYPSIRSCINQISGKIRFINSVEPNIYKNLKSKFINLLKSENKEVEYLSQRDRKTSTQTMYFDEYVDEKNKLLFLCLTLVEDSELVELHLKNLHKKLYQNDFLPQLKGVLDKRILHWVDLSMDARYKLVNTVSNLPFRAYVMCIKFDVNYNEEYLHLFHQLLKSRFLGLDNTIVKIIVENNAIFKENILQSISDKIYSESEKKSNRRPFCKPVVKVVSKEESINVALPDCLLGVLGTYLSSKESVKNELTGFDGKFELLRPKFRFIQLYSKTHKNKPFTSKNPINKSKFNQLICT